MSTKRVEKFKKFVEHESDSLWNYTISPGWTIQDVQVLRNALMLFGIGRWKQILNSKCLPGKSIGQIYIQTQRLIGQQSLGDFMGLNVSLEKIFQENMKKKDVIRKNNCIINTGNNPNKEERKKRISENKKKYGVSQEEIDSIVLPRFSTELSKNCTNLDAIEATADKKTTIEMINQLHYLKSLIEKKINLIQEQDFEYDQEKTTFINLSKKKSLQKNHSKQDITLFEFINVENYQSNHKIGEYPLNLTFQKQTHNLKKVKLLEQNNYPQPIITSNNSIQ